MTDIKFDPKKLAKLNNPERLKAQDPDKYWDQLDLPENPVIVDLGCGTGFFSVEFLRRAKGPNAQVFGLDIAQIMLDWIAENRAEYQEGRLVTGLMQEANIPLEDDLADLLVMINLHHELHRPTPLLEECFRVLKEGAKILIIDWKPTEMPQGPPLKIRVAPEKVVEQLTHSGFEQARDLQLYENFYAVLALKPEA
ncbi:MAG: class I SAM-dependent methyltransferase [bacterium]|nr:class I SAM-dependent methyltransferase [bacterium]